MDKNRKFMLVQIKYLNDAKYFEGINSHKDPGDTFIFDLLKGTSTILRSRWNSSKCQDCLFWRECGHLLKQECAKFIIDKTE